MKLIKEKVNFLLSLKEIICFLQLAHVSGGWVLPVTRIIVFSITSILFSIFIEVNSEKICLTISWIRCKHTSIAISPISLNFLQVTCQNSCSDLSCKIIFNSLSTDNLVISSFNFVESQELASTWPVKWFIMQSWKSFTFSVSGK